MPAESPTPEPNPRSPFLTTAPAIDALARLDKGLGARKPLVVLTGEPGMGKTMLAREAIRRWSERATAVLLSDPHLEAASLSGTLLALFGGSPKPGSSPLASHERLLETFANVTAGGRVAVLVVDDAHTLTDDVLVELQRVTDKAAQRQCPLEVLLVGLPTLATRLDDAPLAAVREQVAARIALAPLSTHDTRRYLLQHPTETGASGAGLFSRKASRDIHAAARGVPRDIEAIASEAARRAARAGVATVSPEHVRVAAQAIRGRRMPAATRPLAAGEAAKGPPPRAAQANGGAKAATPPAQPKPATPPAPASKRAPATKAAGELEDDGTFTPSNDPRVKDWVARFGGSGVRLGAQHAPRDWSEVEDVPVDASEAQLAEASERESGAAATAGGRERARFPPPRALPTKKGPVLGRRRSSNLGWQGVALVVLMAGLAIVLAQRRGVRATDPEPDTNTAEIIAPPESNAEPDERAERAVAPTPAPRPRRVPRNAAPVRMVQDQAPARVIPDEVLEQVVPDAAPERASIPALPAPGTHYTIAVGTYLSADMAKAEKAHLARLTRHRVWVNKRAVDGVKTYRIQIGRFESVEEAEAAAQALLRRGLLRDAQVVELPATR